MAKRKKKQSRLSGAWLGLIAGMVLGVGAAVAVALFVTQAPMPFKDKASRSVPSTLLPDTKDAPDPNIALYGKDGPAGTRPPALGGEAAAGLPLDEGDGDVPPEGDKTNPLSDAIGDIIAGMDKKKASAAQDTAAPPPKKPAPGSDSSAAPAARPSSSDGSKPAPGTQTTYYLQTGAFSAKDDAQTMMARIVMLGLPVHVEEGQSNGKTIHRVRVGPFKGIDDMNRARTRLGDEKIESAVIRP